jgi:hypothetical protein
MNFTMDKRDVGLRNRREEDRIGYERHVALLEPDILTALVEGADALDYTTNDVLRAITRCAVASGVLHSPRGRIRLADYMPDGAPSPLSDDEAVPHTQ